MAEILVGRWRRIACASVAALIAGACSPSTDETASLPPAPQIREVRNVEPLIPDDGLIRLIASIPQAATASDSADDGPPVSGVLETGSETQALSLGQLGQLPADSTLTIRDGDLGYVRSHRHDDGVARGRRARIDRRGVPCLVHRSV